MGRRKLVEYIRDPQLIHELSLEEINQWIVEYPYVSSLHSLLAVKLKGSDPKIFEKAMYTGAMYSTDLRRFHKILQIDKESSSSENEHSAAHSSISDDLDLKEPNQVKASISPGEELENMLEVSTEFINNEPDKELGLEDLSFAEIEDELQTEPDLIELTESQEFEIPEVEDDLEKEPLEFVEGSIQSDSELTIVESDLNDLPDDKANKTASTSIENDELINIPNSEPSIDLVTDVSAEVEKVEDMDEKSRKEQSNENGSEFDLEEELTGHDSPEEDWDDEDSSESQNAQWGGDYQARNSVSGGLSDFSEWLLSLDHDQSTVLQTEIQSNELLSSSLAELLASQGHISKAINMYEKLILINPEKSSFFAAQIEKLKAI